MQVKRTMDIFDIFKHSADPVKAKEMSAYLKNKFSFLGIQKPKRAELAKEFLKEKKKERTIDWPFIMLCYTKQEREYTYLALDYLNSMKNYLPAGDMPKIETLITTNSWWDSVDSLTSTVWRLVRAYPENEAFIYRWMESENIWLRRISIIFQLLAGKNTNMELLKKAIEHNLGSKEFFINKAIGWALRQYAKVDRAWVAAFLSSHTLHPLSVKEAAKHF